MLYDAPRVRFGGRSDGPGPRFQGNPGVVNGTPAAATLLMSSFSDGNGLWFIAAFVIRRLSMSSFSEVMFALRSLTYTGFVTSNFFRGGAEVDEPRLLATATTSSARSSTPCRPATFSLDTLHRLLVRMLYIKKALVDVVQQSHTKLSVFEIP